MAGRQIEIAFDEDERRRRLHPGWGGARKGAGRKPKGKKALVARARRPRHARAHPVHITLRAQRDVPSLRTARMMRAIREALAKANKRTFRVVHFSVQRDHLHLIVEADDGATLRTGMQGLGIRVARAVNRATRVGGDEGRTGKVWADRYHRHDLRSPREVRNALVYVLANHKKHAPTADMDLVLDACSSAPWFDGWRTALGPHVVAFRASTPCPTAAPRTWLIREGWRRHGLIDPRERPIGR